MRPDDADVAWSRMLRQHDDKPRLRGFVKALFAPMTLSGRAIEAISRDLDAIEGAQLDLVGSIVGQVREVPNAVFLAFFGFASQAAGRGFGQARLRREGEPFAVSYIAPDVEYRAMIRAKIALNNSRGLPDEISKAAADIYRAPFASTRTVGPGAAEVRVGRIPLPTEAVVAIEPALPRAAGVRLTTIFYDPAGTFGFTGQTNAVGFGQGPLARSAPSIINPI